MSTDFRQSAANTYAKQVAQITLKLAALREFADSSLDAIGPDEINWGHVGDLSRVISSLDDALAEAEDIRNGC